MHSNSPLRVVPLAAASALLTMWQPAPAQVSQPTAPAAEAGAVQAQTPAHVLYYFLFSHLTWQEQQAAELDRSGQRGDSVREYYKKRIGLSDAEHAALRGASQACQAAVRKQDEAAKAVIDSHRARFPGGKLKPGEPLPSPPAELAQMQVQRDQIILAHIEQLKSAIGAAAFQKLDSYVRNELARNVRSARPVGPLRDGAGRMSASEREPPRDSP